MPRKVSLAKIPEDRLLKLRLKDLKLSLDGTWVKRCLEDLYGELEERGLKIRPHVWLSNEWFSPTTSPANASSTISRCCARSRCGRLIRTR